MPHTNKSHDANKELTQNMPYVVTSFGLILRMPLLSLLMSCIIGLMLFFPISCYVVKKNLAANSAAWDKSATITLYLQKDIEQESVADLAVKLKQNSAVSQVEVISPAVGMQQFTAASGFGDFLTDLKINPLPYVLLVQPKTTKVGESVVEHFIADAKKLPEVTEAKVDSEWLKNSYQLMHLLRYLGLALWWLSAIGAIITVISLAFWSTHYTAARFTGLHHNIIRCQGFWFGLGGGLFSLALTKILLNIAQNCDYNFIGLNLRESIVVLVIGIALSFVGVLLGTAKRLK